MEAVESWGPRGAAGVEADLLRAVAHANVGAEDARPLVVAALEAVGLGDTVPTLYAEVAAAAAREEEDAARAAAAAAAARAALPAVFGEESEEEEASEDDE